MLVAGAACRGIDPPLPHDPQGYVRRETAALRHGDPLQATALILDDGERPAVVVALDLTGADQAAADGMRAAAAEVIGTTPERILLNYSHSHAAPWPRVDGAKLGGGHDHVTAGEQAYFDRLPYDVASVVQAAWQDRREVRVSGGTGTAAGVAVNRRERTEDGRTILGWNPDLAVDEQVPVLRVDALNGSPVATVVAFGCHPVVVGPEVAATGTDFIGPLRRRVELLRGGVCVFLQGAAGNVLPLEAFFDTDGPQVPMGERLGLEAAHAIVDSDPLDRVIRRSTYGSVTPIALYRREIAGTQAPQQLAVRRRVVELPLLVAPSLETLAGEVAERQAELDAALRRGAPRSETNPQRYHLQWLQAMLSRGPALADWRTSPGEVWAMRVGDCAVVGTPGEVFNEIGTAVRRASPFATTLFAGYCQGMVGYIATAAEHPHGGYEPAVSHRGYDHPAPFAPEAEQLLVSTAVDLLDELAGSGT